MVNYPSTRQTRHLSLIFAIFILLISTACGHSEGARQSDHYVTRAASDDKIYEDIEQVLKFDDRVENFETDGGKLIVDVKDSWVSSPPGMQQYALGQWFRHWKEACAQAGVKDGIEVLVQHLGDGVAKATPQDGIQFIEKAREESNTE